MSRLMAIDYGDVRIGIALTDPLKIISSGFATIINNSDVFANIFKIYKDKEVEAIVIGIPFKEDNSIGDAACKVLLFAKKLNEYFKSEKVEIPFYEQDERYTTIEAHYAMKELKLKSKKKKQVVDQIAASRILSDFLKSSSRVVLDVDKYLSNNKQAIL